MNIHLKIRATELRLKAAVKTEDYEVAARMQRRLVLLRDLLQYLPPARQNRRR